MQETDPPKLIFNAQSGPVAQNCPELPKNFEAHQCELPNPGLSPAQQAAIELLVIGTKYSRVAETLGIGRRTLYNWRTTDVQFQAALARRRIEILDGAADQMRSLLHDSLDALAKQVRDTYAPTSHRAARTLLSLSGVGKLVRDPLQKNDSAAPSLD